MRNTFPEWFQSPESMEDLLSESLTETHLDNGEEVLHRRDSELDGSPTSQHLEYNNMVSLIASLYNSMEIRQV